MSGASAFDPSSWADDDEGANDEPVTDAEIVDRIAELDVELAVELAELRELERSTQAQLDKASATVTAAKIELSRLGQRIAEVEQDIADAGEG